MQRHIQINPTREVTGDWVEASSLQPIAFAQVREDAGLDLRIAKMLGSELNGVMVASGGCTACALAASARFKNIDIVDLNQAQLVLTKLKLNMLTSFEPEVRLAVLGHKHMPVELRANYLERIFDEIEDHLPDMELRNFEPYSRLGPDHCGRYEMVFRALSETLNRLNSDCLSIFRLDNVEEQRTVLRRPEIRMAFECAFYEVFSQSNLCRLFGEDATSNSVKPFHEHFWHQTSKALESMPARSNPFLSQMFLGKFQAGSYYQWLTSECSEQLPRMNFHQSSMGEFLESGRSNSYDFVHLSNILDWLNVDEASHLLDQAHRVLKPGGMLIIRQLNSSLNIRGLAPEINWNAELSDKLLARDRSFFYSAIHVGAK